MYPIFYLIVVLAGWLVGLLKGPIWALLTYVFIYFNIPQHQWWAGYVPYFRWSFVSAGILVTSCLLKRNQLRQLSWFSIPGFRWLFILQILMLFIVPFSVNTQVSWSRSYDFLRYLIIFLLIVLIINDFQKVKLYLFLFLGQVFYLSWMAYSYFHGNRLDCIGTVDAGAANEFAILLLSTIPFLIIFVLRGNWFERVASVCMLPFILNAFAMCRSRSGFLGLITAMLALVFSENNKRFRFRVLAGVCLGAIMLYFLIDPSYKQRLLTIEKQPLAESSAGRTEIWKYGIKMVADYPWGTGGGGFMYLSPTYIPKRLIEKSVGQRASHNTYLLVLVEQGPLGLLIFLLFIKDIFSCLHKSKSLLKEYMDRDSSRLLSLLCSATFSSISGILVASFFNDRLYYEGFYLIAALSPVCYYLALDQAKEV